MPAEVYGLFLERSKKIRTRKWCENSAGVSMLETPNELH